MTVGRAAAVWSGEFMKTLARYGLLAISFGMLIYLMVSFPLGSRGYHFATETRQSARIGDEDEEEHDLARLRILTRAVGFIRSYYVEPERISPTEMLVGTLEEVQRILPPLLVDIERDEEERPRAVSVTVYDDHHVFSLERISDVYEMNWKLLDIFEFIARRIPAKDRREKIEYAAINGMLRTLDPHSAMLSPEVYRDMKLGTQGEFGGLGIVISIRAGYLTVVSVIDDTPAFAAGLQSGDRIVQIGEESTVNMALNEAVNRLRGEPGTMVTIWIARDEWPDQQRFQLERDRITIKSAEGRPLGRGVGYMRLKHFQKRTMEDLSAEISDLRASGHWRGLILDLRDNPGGLLEQAVQVSDLFLSEGAIVTTVGAGNTLRDELHATPEGTLTDIPIVVLVNRGSASGSEIVAGALQSNDRALVIGDKTFGKGSVQVLYDIDDAALKLTVAQYLTPGERSIQSVGIVPDLLLLPMSVTDDRLTLFASRHHERSEETLPKHLEGDPLYDEVAPKFILRYLRPDDKERAEDRDEDEFNISTEALRRDRTIRFAESLLTRASLPTRAHLLERAAQLHKDSARDEERAVHQALARFDVDWRPAPHDDDGFATPAPVSLTVTTSPSGAAVEAGQEIEFSVTAQNNGSLPLHRVHAVSSSSFDRFDRMEFAFGLLRPGERRSWSTKVQLSKAAMSRLDEVVVELFADGRSLERRATVTVETTSLPQPRYSFSTQVVDREHGNDDGRVQRGERFGLRVHIENIGEGPSHDPVATITNLSGDGVFINHGRAEFDRHEPGSHSVLDFDLEVRPSFEEDELALELMVLDMTLRTQFRRRIRLPIHPASTGGSNPFERVVLIGPEGALVRGGTFADSDVIGSLPPSIHLRSMAATESHILIDLDGPLGEDAVGWIAKEEIEKHESIEEFGRRPDGARMIVRRSQNRAPMISFAEVDTPPLEHDSDYLPLRARILFPKAPDDLSRHAYVYVGTRKIAFSEAVAESGADVELILETAVPLEFGSNRITLFASLGDEPPATTTVRVYRPGEPPPPVELMWLTGEAPEKRALQ